MSGILGIWHPDGRPADRAELARLAATIRHRGGDAEGLRIDGAAGLAVHIRRVTPESARETQPVVDDQGAMLAFDGRLDDRDDLIAALDGDGGVSRESPDSSLVLAAYRRLGEACLARLNGDFALAVHDPRRRRLLLARDAIGVRPLYYHATPQLVIFASEIKAIVAHPDVPARPDDETLADFLFTRFTGAPPTPRTFFEHVSSVLPGYAVIVDAGGVRMAPYWDFDAARAVRFARYGDYVDAFREHFDRAVRRRLRCVRPTAVSVSGGLDSSAIFCAAHRIVRCDGRVTPPIGVAQTFPDGSPSDEKVFLADLERSSGSPILRLHDPPVGMTDSCRDAIWHSEMPFLDGQWNATHALLSAARQCGAPVLLTGHWGDQFLF
ncbi:MAG TPA: asparagine synthase-related protein, partial [Vicinamibacterales bacterium]|nr:asparagine synthase-related protein [Vicinamibacterales bacterium]